MSGKHISPLEWWYFCNPGQRDLQKNESACSAGAYTCHSRLEISGLDNAQSKLPAAGNFGDLCGHVVEFGAFLTSSEAPCCWSDPLEHKACPDIYCQLPRAWWGHLLSL